MPSDVSVMLRCVSVINNSIRGTQPQSDQRSGFLRVKHRLYQITDWLRVIHEYIRRIQVDVGAICMNTTTCVGTIAQLSASNNYYRKNLNNISLMEGGR